MFQPNPFDAPAGAVRVNQRRTRAERVYLDLVRTYQSAILNYIWRMVGDPEVAEDLTQDSFLKAWRALNRLELGEDAEARRRAWLYRIAHNTAADHLRRKARLRWISFEAVRGIGEGDPTHEVEVREPLVRTLDALSDDHRQVLLLFEQHGLSSEEVASVLGISDTAARKRRQRARNAFQTAYDRITGDRNPAQGVDPVEGDDRVEGEDATPGVDPAQEVDPEDGAAVGEAEAAGRLEDEGTEQDQRGSAAVAAGPAGEEGDQR